jgi:hypothetical protein
MINKQEVINKQVKSKIEEVDRFSSELPGSSIKPDWLEQENSLYLNKLNFVAKTY